MVSLVQHIFSPLAFGSLLAAIGLNVAVLTMCNYLELRGGGQSLGLFGFKPAYGDYCVSYEGSRNDSDVKAARAGSLLALLFGAAAFFLLLTKRFCCKIPYEQLWLMICFLGAQIFATLTWLVYHNRLCEVWGCDWGSAATINLICQILYLTAAMFSPCVPDHETLQLEERREEEEEEDIEPEKGEDSG